MIEGITKECRLCEREKGRDEFSVNKKNKDGRETMCKDCCNAALRAKNRLKAGELVKQEKEKTMFMRFCGLNPKIAKKLRDKDARRKNNIL